MFLQVWPVQKIMYNPLPLRNKLLAIPVSSRPKLRLNLLLRVIRLQKEDVRKVINKSVNPAPSDYNNKFFDLRGSSDCCSLIPFRIKRESLHMGIYFFPDLSEYHFIFRVLDRIINKIYQSAHMPGIHTPGGDGRYTHADTGSNESALIVERHHVFIDGNIRFNQCGFRFFPTDVFIPQVDQHQMIICSA